MAFCGTRGNISILAAEQMMAFYGTCYCARNIAGSLIHSFFYLPKGVAFYGTMTNLTFLNASEMVAFYRTHNPVQYVMS